MTIKAVVCRGGGRVEVVMNNLVKVRKKITRVLHQKIPLTKLKIKFY